MTDEQFCKIYSSYNGEKMSHVDQLVQETFTGRELKEIIDFFISQMKQRTRSIGIIGHIDHGKTTLSAAINIAMAQKPIEPKTINEIIDEEKSIPYTLNVSKNVDYDITISNRRERRRRDRNKKTK